LLQGIIRLQEKIAAEGTGGRVIRAIEREDRSNGDGRAGSTGRTGRTARNGVERALKSRWRKPRSTEAPVPAPVSDPTASSS
jgi:hypothetical protein